MMMSEQPLQFITVDGRLSSFVDSTGLCLGDAFHLPLTAKLGLKLGEHSQQVERQLPINRARVEGLFGGTETCPSGLESPDNILQVAY